MLAQHQVGLGHADVFGTHDLVGRSLLEHPVLMDARLVGERVAAHDRLVALDGQPGDRREHPADRIEALGLDAGREAVVVETGLERHHDFLERGIAGALADAVDRAFDLACSGLAAGQAVGDRQAEVVVAVGADDRPLDIGHALLERADHLAVLQRRGVADGIGNVDGGGAGFDGGLDDLAKKVDLGAGGVFGAELDVRAISLGPSHAGDGLLDDLGLGHPQLVLAVNGRSGQKDVDPRFLSVLDGFPGAVDVAVVAPGQPADRRAGDFRGDGPDRLEVAGGGDRKPGLDHVDAECGERAGDLDLLGHDHARAGRLLAVAQGGVEDPDAVGVGRRRRCRRRRICRLWTGS